MFEKLIICLMNLLKVCSREVERAYYETYGDKELAIDFNEEVELRKERNRKLFLIKAACHVGREILERDNILVTEAAAMEIAEGIFRQAKREGKLDVLNNYIEKEK